MLQQLFFLSSPNNTSIEYSVRSSAKAPDIEGKRKERNSWKLTQEMFFGHISHKRKMPICHLASLKCKFTLELSAHISDKLY